MTIPATTTPTDDWWEAVRRCVSSPESPDVAALDRLVAAPPEAVGGADGGDWMGALVRAMTTTTTSSSGCPLSPGEALAVVTALAGKHPDRHLAPLADRVSARVSSAAPGTLCVPPALRATWVSLLAHTTHVAVHERLLSALLDALVVLPGGFLGDVLEDLVVRTWKPHQDFLVGRRRSGPTATLTVATSSIVVVRCATAYAACLVRLGDAAHTKGAALGATKLLEELLGDASDPLRALSVLDLLSEQLGGSDDEDGDDDDPLEAASGLQTDTKEWLRSPPMVRPALGLLHDPLLAGAALRYLSLVGTLGGEGDDRAKQLRGILLSHVSTEIGPTTNESDRLGVARALGRLARLPWVLEHEILPDRDLRACWWDLSRCSSPKLRAAVLASLAQLLAFYAGSSRGSSDPSSSARLGVRCYALLAADNGATTTTTTTEWLFAGPGSSPIPELRIAAHQLWRALAGLPSGAALLAASPSFLERMVREDQPREPTGESRIALHACRASFREHAGGFLAAGLVKKLDALLARGPHGAGAARPWDVALE